MLPQEAGDMAGKGGRAQQTKPESRGGTAFPPRNKEDGWKGGEQGSKLGNICNNSGEK